MDQSTRTCSIDGCGRVIYGHGWCSMHYTRARRHGDPLWSPPAKTGGPCAVDGCNEASSRRSALGVLCRAHHRRWEATGDPNRNPSGRVIMTRYGATECGACGRERTVSGGTLRCLPCIAREGRDRYRDQGERARSQKALSSQRRRATQKEAICSHGARCVSASDLTVMGRTCVYCGAPAEEADHLMPLARGGLHCTENLVPACQHCNRRKSDKDPFVWLLELEQSQEGVDRGICDCRGRRSTLASTLAG